MKPKKKKNKKRQFSSVKALLKADREHEIEQYGKQVSMRPSRVHKSKKDYDRKKNKVDEREMEWFFLFLQGHSIWKWTSSHAFRLSCFAASPAGAAATAIMLESKTRACLSMWASARSRSRSICRGTTYGRKV